MGDFGAIVRVVGRVVGGTGHDVPLGNSVAAQLVGHETTRFLSLTLQALSEESPRRTPVPTGLDEKVNQVTALVHGAPQRLALTVDRDEDFVQQPRLSESTLTSLQPPGVIGAELPAAGWPGEVTLPGLPQIRTCPIRASGSSAYGLAARR